jgi:Cu/Ag efflux pump CusA
VSLAQLCEIEMKDGASEIYREANQRYVAIKYSVRGRDLGGAVEEAIKKVDQHVKLPVRLSHRLGRRVRIAAARAGQAGDHHSPDPAADLF